MYQLIQADTRITCYLTDSPQGAVTTQCMVRDNCEHNTLKV